MLFIRRIIRYIYVFFILKYKKIILRFLGAKIGKNCIIYTSLFNFDKYYTKLIEIGNNVTITKGVILLCHDAAFGIKNMRTGKIRIGNHVFIGMNSIILPGVSIGNNVIIGAGSVVNKDIKDNTLVAGNPAKFIKRL